MLGDEVLGDADIYNTIHRVGFVGVIVSVSKGGYNTIQGIGYFLFGVEFACAVFTIFLRMFTILSISASNESNSMAYNLEAFSS